MEFPSDLYYSKDHEWIRVQGNIGTVGITDFAQGELGDIVYIDIQSLGQTIKQFELFGTVEAVKTVSDLFLPVSGKIIEVNSALQNAPESVNNDPYQSGWMVKIELSNPEELGSLMKSDVYAASVGH